MLTPLPLQMLPQIWESWLKFYLMQVFKPWHYALVETVEPFKLHPMSMAYLYEVFERLLRLWMSYGITLTLLPPQMLPRFVRVGGNPTSCKCANHATMLWLRL